MASSYLLRSGLRGRRKGWGRIGVRVRVRVSNQVSIPTQVRLEHAGTLELVRYQGMPAARAAALLDRVRVRVSLGLGLGLGLG